MEGEAIEEGDLPGLRAARAGGAKGLGVGSRVISEECRLCSWRKEVAIRAGRAGQRLGLGSVHGLGTELGVGGRGAAKTQEEAESRGRGGEGLAGTSGKLTRKKGV